MKRMWLVTAMSVAVCAGAPAVAQERTTGETIDDSSIATATKMGLMDEEAVSAGDINVETYKGDVQLIGFVESEAAKTAAITKAKSIEGVKKVTDALVVMEGKRSMGRVVDDETLHAKVKMAVADSAGVGGAVDVVVKVREGEVLLGGFVDQAEERQAILDAAESVEGIEKIHNKIGVRM